MKQHATIVLSSAFMFASISLCFLGFGSCTGRAGADSKSVCLDIERRYDETIAAGGACRKDADCGCYGNISRKSGCGGVTDKKTAARLSGLANEFHRAGCSVFTRCAPGLCVPACVKGMCARGKRTGP